MRAMQLVSGSKLKRAQTKLLQGRAVLEFLDGLLKRVLAATSFDSPHRQTRLAQDGPERSRGTEGLDHPLCEKRLGGENALVLITSDAGLCGSYNTNLIQLAETYLQRDSARRTQLVSIGKKGYRYFVKRGYAVAESYLDLAGRPNAAQVEAMGRSLMDRFLSGRVNSVKLLYSRFHSSTVYRPTLRQWLPIQLDRATGKPTSPPSLEYIFEPSPENIFEDLLPRWVLATFQVVLLEAFTSEHSARMIAMKNATDNAEELLSSLTRQRNKIRQASITKELSEIVGTAEALK